MSNAEAHTKWRELCGSALGELLDDAQISDTGTGC